MPGVLAWGYYPTDKIWLPIQVDANGCVKANVSAGNLDDIGDVDVPSPTDGYILYWDAATSLWKCRALVDADIPATICRDSELAYHETLPDVHHATHLKTLADHPLSIIPTMDDDHIPATIARDAEVATAVSDHAALTTGVHWADANGVVTFPAQSGAMAFRIGAVLQKIPNAVWTHVAYSGEDYDMQSEFDSSIKTGNATATTANHLIDTTANQFAASDVGKAVYNHTDGTYATVTAYNSVSDLTLDTDIMANGETYEVYFARFTAKVAGVYLVMARVYILGMTVGHQIIAKIKKNGADVASQKLLLTGTADGYITCVRITTLAIGDYLDGWVYQNEGGTKTLYQATGAIWLTVQKIA